MRAFQFNLQRVLSYRETVEDARMTELAAIAREHEQQAARLHGMRALRHAFRDRMKARLEQGDPEVIRRAHSYLLLLSDRIAVQEDAVSRLARQREEKTAEAVAASQDRQILDRLKQAKAGEHRREALLDEQKFLDDVAGARHRADVDARPR